MRYQSLAKDARDNYERELRMHASLSTQCAELETGLAETRQQAQASSAELARKTTDWIRREKHLEDERAALQLAAAGVHGDMSDLRRTNDLLQNQLHSLASKAEKVQDSYLQRLTAGATGGETLENVQKIEDLQKNCVDLREIVYNTKKDRDILNAKFNAKSDEKDRIEIKLSATEKVYYTSRI